MQSNSKSPASPYFAVIFASKRTNVEQNYSETAERMDELAREQPGFLGIESARNESGEGITVSYWDCLENIQRWKQNLEHLSAQLLGKDIWYEEYSVRICEVQREYSFERK